MSVQSILFKEEINRNDVAFILKNKDDIRQAAIQNGNTQLLRRWEAMLGKNRSLVLEYWLKGVLIENPNSGCCTSWTHTIDVHDFTNMKVQVIESIRVKQKASDSDLEKARYLDEFARTYYITDNVKDQINDDIQLLRRDDYNWITPDEFLESEQSKYLDVFGAITL